MNELFRRILFLPPQSSTVARQIDFLHYSVISATMAGAVVITLVGLVFTVRYRARGELRREDPGPPPPRWLELSVVAFLLGLFCLWWLIGFLQYVRIRVPPDGAMTVYVTAKQWMWKFAYPDGESGVATLYVPTGRPVRLLLTSRDVIHSFYVPDFRLKYDVLPGRYTTLWFEVPAPGTHLILCAEYCGAGHSMMRGQVVALAPEDYARWRAAARKNGEPPDRISLPGPPPGAPLTIDEIAPAAPLSMVRVGEEVAAQQGCLRCHTLDGSPHIGPSWAGIYGAPVPLAGGGSVVADEAYLTESMMDPLARIRAGYQPVMPSYHGLITPAEVAAIVQLIKSLGPPAPPPTSSLVPPAGALGRVSAAPSLSTAPPSPEGLPPPGVQREPPPEGQIQTTAAPRRSP
jgi:cytochrome c oxidase subunit 2